LKLNCMYCKVSNVEDLYNHLITPESVRAEIKMTKVD